MGLSGAVVEEVELVLAVRLAWEDEAMVLYASK